ncbi:unnamed protein product [Merluccius merluccius]
MPCRSPFQKPDQQLSRWFGRVENQYSDNVGLQPPLVSPWTTMRHEVGPEVLGARNVQQTEVLMSPKPKLDRRLVKNRGAQPSLPVYICHR